MSKKKILILTAPVGGGHIAAAKAITAELQQKYGRVYDIEMVDVFADKDLRLLLPIEKIAVPAYSNSVKMLNSYPYKLFYDFANVSPKFVSKFFTSIFKDKGAEYLKQKDPDIIVSTFPIISYAAGRILDKWPKRIPVVSIVTDAGAIHKLWLMDPNDDILVSTPDTIDYAVSQGVPRERLHYLGFPISQVFAELPTKAEAREQLGLADKPTVLLSGGGLGLSNKLTVIAKHLARDKVNAQFLFIGGHNQKLVDQLRAINLPGSTVFGFVDNVPTLMAASDLFVGKAGWLHLYEAMVARRPAIIIDVIPGQEEPNAQFVERNGVGRVIKDPAAASDAIAELVTHPDKLLAYERHFDRLNLDPRAGEKIADFIVEQIGD